MDKARFMRLMSEYTNSMIALYLVDSGLIQQDDDFRARLECSIETSLAQIATLLEKLENG